MDDRAPSEHRCHLHDNRQADITCPQCKKYCCVFCWHSNLRRCESCLRENPAAAVAPVPWENGPRPWPGRLSRTLLGAFSPIATAPAFARANVMSAARFALATALPLSLLSGILPHTRTLMFADLEVTSLSDSQLMITLDVLRAMGVQLARDLARLTAIWLPYISLLKAYAGPQTAPFGMRTILYRFWLFPAHALCSQLLLWTQAPPLDGAPLGPGIVLSLELLRFLPVLFMLALGFSARLACGLSGLWSIIVVTVAVAVSACVDVATIALLTEILPPL